MRHDESRAVTDLAAKPPLSLGLTRPLFAATIFLSAGLTFLVQPMIARMLLPMLGGSPAVWNTSMAFFQAALLLGYAYAHGLQRLGSVRRQVAVHAVVLLAAAAVLPVRVPELLGEPQADAPIIWLLSALALSVGAPFAALSATAPLIQAWYARARSASREGADPYVLYAASNLGSLIGLVAYPLLVEPTLGLPDQAAWWTAGFLVFGALLLAAGVQAWRAPTACPAPAAEAEASTRPTTWRDRLIWVGLAAVPSSLLLGVTTHLSTDVAAAPFLWVAPLALYLVTFILAFQAKPILSRDRALFWQGGLLPVAMALLLVRSTNLALLLGVGLTAFFFAALVCHQRLAERRPPPDRLTEFYLWLSLGGVLGGSFNAFLAPILFDNVWEYPLALVLTALARPWKRGRLSILEMVCLAAGLFAIGGAVLQLRGGTVVLLQVFTAVAIACAFLVRDRTWAFVLLLIGMASQTHAALPGSRQLAAERGFFGTLRVDVRQDAQLGPVHALYHGTTLHGAQALRPDRRCTPMTYYAPTTPIGQAFAFVQSRDGSARLGVVGLGAGSVAAYVREADRLRFFEIDPLVARFARDQRYFTYMSDCARGPVDIVLGDARLKLTTEPVAAYDLLLIDAFSSDSVPTHLLTTEAMRIYLERLAPDGLLVLHLSNRHLNLQRSAAATVEAAGGAALLQNFKKPSGAGSTANASDVMVVAKSPAVLETLAMDPRWRAPRDVGGRAWSDSYVNIVGALIEGARSGG